MDTETRADHRAERLLLSRARRGEMEAVRGLLHRYASLVWAACALVTTDEDEAAERFGECWDAILRSLGSARRAPDLAGMILGKCQACLAEAAPEDRVARAIASAHQLAAEGSAYLEAPAEALAPVTDSLSQHAERLERETADRRARRRHGVILPAGAGVAILAGAIAAYVSASRPSTEDFLARRIRDHVVGSDLVPRFRDVVQPPFEVSELEGPELRQYEEISLVLEEIANLPPEVDAEQAARLQRRVEALDLVDFAAHEAEKTRGANQAVMNEVCLVLEEVANL